MVIPLLSIDETGKVVIEKIPLETSQRDTATPKIDNLEGLANNLPNMCSSIFKQIGSQQTKAIYQRCLKKELEEASLTVILEPVLQLTYRGDVVGSQTCDLIIETRDGSARKKAVIQICTVDELQNEHRDELEYYLHYSGIQDGFLINFPHDKSFPSVNDKSSFQVKLLMKQVSEKLASLFQAQVMSIPRNASRSVEVVRFWRQDIDNTSKKDASCKNTKPNSTKTTARSAKRCSWSFLLLLLVSFPLVAGPLTDERLLRDWCGIFCHFAEALVRLVSFATKMFWNSIKHSLERRRRRVDNQHEW